MLRGLSVKAMLIGFVLDWALSFLVGLIIGVGLVVYLIAVLHKPATDQAALDALMKSDIVCLGTCIVAVPATMAVGFLAGWIARSHRIKNALATGLLSAVSSTILLPLMNGYPAWYFPVSLVLTIAACTLGGVIAHGLFGERATSKSLSA